MEEVLFLGLRSLLTGKAQDVTHKGRPSEGETFLETFGIMQVHK